MTSLIDYLKSLVREELKVRGWVKPSTEDGRAALIELGWKPPQPEPKGGGGKGEER